MSIFYNQQDKLNYWNIMCTVLNIDSPNITDQELKKSNSKITKL